MHISLSLKTKQESPCKQGFARPTKAECLLSALDDGAELRRAKPCDPARGEPLMCHINPSPLSLASARTMMSSATVESCQWQPGYMNLPLAPWSSGVLADLFSGHFEKQTHTHKSWNLFFEQCCNYCHHTLGEMMSSFSTRNSLPVLETMKTLSGTRELN